MGILDFLTGQQQAQPGIMTPPGAAPQSSGNPILDQIQQGILSLNPNQQPAQQTLSEKFALASKALNAFSQNYNAALVDPRTRGVAFGAGAGAAGDVLSAEGLKRQRAKEGFFGPNATPEEKLAALGTLADVQNKITPKAGKGGSSEFERIIQNLVATNQITPEQGAMMLQKRAEALATEGSGDTRTPLQKLIAARDALAPDDPNRKTYNDAIAKESTRDDSDRLTKLIATRDSLAPGDPRRKIYEDAIKKESQFAPNSSTNVTVSPTITGGNVSTPLTKSTTDVVQKDIVGIESNIEGLIQSAKTLDPKDYDVANQVENKVTSFREKLSNLPILNSIPGFAPSEQEQKNLAEYTQRRSQIARTAADIINQLYGAGLTGGEEARANTFVPAPDDSYSVAYGKLQGLIDFSKSILARRNRELNKGIEATTAGIEGAGSPAQAFNVPPQQTTPNAADLAAAAGQGAPPAAAGPPAGPQVPPQAPPAALPPPAAAPGPPALPNPGPGPGPQPQPVPVAPPGPGPQPQPVPNAPAGPPPDPSSIGVDQSNFQQFLPPNFQPGTVDPSGAPVGYPEPSSIQEGEAIAQAMLAAGVAPDKVLEWGRARLGKLTGGG